MLGTRHLRNLINRYSEQLYRDFLKNPNSVHSSWRAYFEQLNSKPDQVDLNRFEQDVVKATQGDIQEFAATGVNMPTLSELSFSSISSHQKVQLLTRAYQVRGHHIAKLDPLELGHADLDANPPVELFPDYYGLENMEQEYSLGPGILSRFVDLKPKMPLKDILSTLQNIYCKSIGIEYFHIPSRVQCDWLREKFEIPQPYKFNPEKKKVILDRLMWADHFEQFVAQKYPSDKRFGLEGCESLIPGMKALIDKAVDMGVNNVVMGMPHRGRLNVLSNVARKPNESLFNEFKGTHLQEVEGSGDVKYHLGMTYDRPTPSGRRVQISLCANPSHLEAVDPVVVGKAKALQQQQGNNTNTMSILLHGDAAFAGQGVVYETFGISELPSYETGGTIHIIVNNQIGFTTDPRFSRSTAYCSDVAKTVGAPILHVNGDDVEAVVFCMEIAAEWRQTYHKDVVIDIVCYRKYGHNEIDQPMFTQPKMYQKISKMVPVVKKYMNQLEEEQSVSSDFIQENSKRIFGLLEASYERSKDYLPEPKEWVSSVWAGFPSPQQLHQTVSVTRPTGVDLAHLKQIGIKACTLPETFSCNKALTRIINSRLKSIEQEEGIDWSTAELLAFGSLLTENKYIRLSGQDVERGTFSQRHAVLIDQKTEERLVVLNKLSATQANFTASNSSLSEYGILGFELGYSFVDPNGLVIWEAQFGDFSNGAQIIIDQFIVSGERKWFQASGLILTLPHGYDGQGPEHSSARIERFLQMSDEPAYQFPTELEMQRQYQDCNIQLVYPSTPSNYFHVLRRQVSREFRKPLILPFSKSLLRHPMAKSGLKEMSGTSEFVKVYSETNSELVANNKIKRVLFCSGQVYYALVQSRELNKLNNVAIIRIEEITPFPWFKVKEEMEKYKNADIVWAQEEPINMGMWGFVEPRLKTCANEINYKNHLKRQGHTEHNQPKTDTILVCARPPNAAVATGVKKNHVMEEQQLISDSLFGEYRKVEEVINGLARYESK